MPAAFSAKYAAVYALLSMLLLVRKASAAEEPPPPPPSPTAASGYSGFLEKVLIAASIPVLA